VPLEQVFHQTKNYFKAGNYIQSNVADYSEATGDYSTVVIQSLSVTHSEDRAGSTVQQGK
jgi:hypothetical protein